MNIQEKLKTIQQELKSPKNQYNKFGKYNYRSLEDILESVKPLLEKTKTVLTISDEMVDVCGRVYVKAVAVLYDTESTDKLIATANAREAESQKGMQDSQLTGSTSSYARKYCLNGLFCIDDTKDADTQAPEIPNKSKTSPFLGKMKAWATNEPDTYWQVLGQNGVEKASEVKAKDQDRILKEMQEALKGIL